MKKYFIIVIFIIALIFTSWRVRQQNINSHLSALMLKNIECLATPENNNIRCFFSGTIDCPAMNIQVLYYF